MTPSTRRKVPNASAVRVAAVDGTTGVCSRAVGGTGASGRGSAAAGVCSRGVGSTGFSGRGSLMRSPLHEDEGKTVRREDRASSADSQGRASGSRQVAAGGAARRYEPSESSGRLEREIAVRDARWQVVGGGGDGFRARAGDGGGDGCRVPLGARSGGLAVHVRRVGTHGGGERAIRHRPHEHVRALCERGEGAEEAAGGLGG